MTLDGSHRVEDAPRAALGAATRSGHSRERDRRAPNGATNHNRCGEKPDCRQKRFLPHALASTSGKDDADAADVSGAALAKRAVESSAQLEKGRGSERERGGGKGLRAR